MMMCSACKFIEQIVVDNEVLHVKPDPPALLDKTPLNCTYYKKILVHWMLYVHILHSYNIIETCIQI